MFGYFNPIQKKHTWLDLVSKVKSTCTYFIGDQLTINNCCNVVYIRGVGNIGNSSVILSNKEDDSSKFFFF